MPTTSSRSNRLLTLFFGLAVLIQFGYLLVGFASIAPYYHHVVSQTIQPKVVVERLVMSNEIVAQEAAERGLSLAGYARFRIAFASMVALIPVFVAVLILRSVRWQWYTWFTAFVLFFLAEYSLQELTIGGGLISLKVHGSNAIFWFLILLFIFLFPNGQTVPRSLGWIVIGLVVYHFFIQVGTAVAYIAPEFAAQANLPNWGDSLFIFPVLINFLLVLAGQLYRYRRISTPIERQQTKWFVFGFGMVIALSLVSLLSQGRGGYIDDVASLSFTPIPIALGFAILRYHLFDIDVIIRRTLVWGAITAILGLLYFGGVTLLQSVFSSASGEQSPAAVVVSTLAIAALFNPLRHRVQEFVDRRFYRQRYDAEKTLESFAASVRNEVELEQLSRHLLSVVEETMQPKSTGLWLKPAAGRPQIDYWQPRTGEKRLS